MNNLYDLTRHLDKYRELCGQEPTPQAVQFFASFCAALAAMHHIGQQARRRGAAVSLQDFHSAMPEDAQPEIVSALYGAYLAGRAAAVAS